MRYRLTAPIVGNLLLPDGARTMMSERDGRVLALHADEKSRVRKVSITIPIPPELSHKFTATISKEPDGISHIKIFGDKLISAAALKELQLFESSFAFIFDEHPLEQVHWQRWKEEYVPDTDEERQRLEVPWIGAPYKAGPEPVTLRQGVLDNCFQYALRNESLMVPMGFYREGMNAFHRERYVTAFHSFYYIVEDFFANGKTSEKQVLREFAASKVLQDFLNETLKAFSGSDKHDVNLRRFLAEERCAFDVPGLMRFLFKIRGNLHHYFGKSPRTHATPFNQQDFEVIALMTMHLAGNAIMNRVVEINLEAEPEHPPGYDAWMDEYWKGRKRPDR